MNYYFIIPLIIIFVLFEYLIIYPEKKKIKKFQLIFENISIGDILCINGDKGKVIDKDNDKITINVNGKKVIYDKNMNKK